MITVIVPAYKAQNFIEQCLDSIFRQRSKVPFQVIVGIDGCKDTLSTMKLIKDKYDNLHVVYFPKNRGTYITLNSMIDFVQDGWIMVFGADDEMRQGMITNMWRSKPCYSKFSGISILEKKHYDQLGGYMPWRVAADTEMKQRICRIPLNFRQLPQMFTRGIHKDQMTRSKTHGFGSHEREKCAKYIKDTRFSAHIFVAPIIHDKFEVI